MPTDLWDDMARLNALYEELMWDNNDELEFIIENNRIVIYNKTQENE
jgi:hypothetical protein|tara:strand:- start:44 stop:184 length:141 start_codon:yes stop_codon:yes gene_type:complete